MKVTRDSLVSGLPMSFTGEITSLVPIVGHTSLLLVTIDYHGLDVIVPLTREAVSKLLLKPKLSSAEPGEVLPVPKARDKSRATKVGPEVGTIRNTNSGKKFLEKYDFITPKLKGKRRVQCPQTGKKGFPVWKPLAQQ